MARLIVIAAGGTGGHMFPAQALAEAMLARGWRVRLSTDERGARYAGGFPDAVEIVTTRSATFSRGNAPAKLLVPFRIAFGLLGTTLRMVLNRPAVVVGFGGYPTIPALGAAWVLRLPRMIHEQNGVLGRVNTAFAKRVSKVACGTWPTKLPDGADGLHTGNPVRSAILAEAGAPYVPATDGDVRLLVIGGSQGARILSDVVPPAVAALPVQLQARLKVAHQARGEDEARVRHFYAENNIAAEVQPFFTDIPDRMRDAHLVISRAGASSIADLTVIGRPAILIPYAAATGNHQAANAKPLAEAGGAVVLTEDKLTQEALTDRLATLLGVPQAASKMAANMLKCGTPDATERLVNLVEGLAESKR